MSHEDTVVVLGVVVGYQLPGRLATISGTRPLLLPVFPVFYGGGNVAIAMLFVSPIRNERETTYLLE
ncbi:MAG: hypothetical protein P8J33_15730 [Pirellulaceae bacterium]|nr:hypothetical protein [Pirellulaceae bacterium]